MKLHFEPNLDYQLAAIESVCDLFRGQEICRTEFTVTQAFGGGQAALAGLENDLGVGNRLSLLDDEILANLNDVQFRNGLKPYKESEKTGGERPIDLIRATRPIVIVDEPQSVDGGLAGRGKEALGMMSPLSTLRYSATHVEKHHMVFRLDAVDAYERKLVKQIEVAAAGVEGDHNKPFIRLVSVANRRGAISAKVELDIQRVGRVSREEKNVRDDDDLVQVTGRAMYSNCRIGEIRVERGKELLEGDYASWFEEEYRRLAGHPDYRSLFNQVDVQTDASLVHDGYFSQDKKGTWSDTAENNQGNRDNAERAYNLIMKDKEKLLGFETKLKFIFSHSALREGWDNPNVFQICALREMGTERERRQTIGRGLRLCVNQQGDRLRGFDVNTLTVIATESYEQFADSLQKEIEQDTGIRFGIVEKHQFAAIPVIDASGRTVAVGVGQSEAIWNHLRDTGMVDPKGKVQDRRRLALKDDTFTLPEAFAAPLGPVRDVLRKLAGKLEIKNADERLQVKTRQAILHSEEFKALWDRIKHKTTYRVEFDNERLIKTCVGTIKTAPPITKTRLTWRKADLMIGKAGVEATEPSVSAPIVLEEHDLELPDLLTDLQDKTQLTRKSIVRILTASGRPDDFKKNPQEFIDIASESMNRAKRFAIVDGIKYQRLGDADYYAQELFEQEELSGYLKNLLAATKSVHEHVIYDSAGVERSFAEQMERSEAVKVYAKLPGWFTVPTPLGAYNPDWAVLVEKDGAERLYLVVETKSSLFADDLRDRESAKIKCGEEHFKAIAVGANPAHFVKATKLVDVLLM